MSDDRTEMLARIERDKDQLLDFLAKMSLDYRFDLELEPDEDSPLAELFVAAKMAADNIGLLTRQLEQRLETIAAQQQAIQELSTPALQIWDRILVMPLVGTLDTARAAQLTERLLEAVSEHQAEGVIIDITGLPVVDSQVARSLAGAVQGCRLLGAQCVVTGMNPSVAQTLIRSGIPLGDVPTMGSLQAGLKQALQRGGWTISR